MMNGQVTAIMAWAANVPPPPAVMVPGASVAQPIVVNTGKSFWPGPMFTKFQSEGQVEFNISVGFYSDNGGKPGAPLVGGVMNTTVPAGAAITSATSNDWIMVCCEMWLSAATFIGWMALVWKGGRDVSVKPYRSALVGLGDYLHGAGGEREMFGLH